MIIPGAIVGALTGMVMYVIVAVGWFAANTSEARSSYHRAELWQRLYSKDDPDIPGELADAEESARRARLALVWPYAIGLHVARWLRASIADNREIASRSTELHADQRARQIERMEREIERLRREQDGHQS